MNARSLNRPLRDAPRKHGGGRRQMDPWGAVDGDKQAEQSQWLLSYLDLMTLLFSFFVLLFAHQKALNVEQAQAPSAAPVAVAAAVQQAAPPPETPVVKETPPDVAAPSPLQPALAAAAVVGRTLISDAGASEQTAAQLGALLVEETEKKQVNIERADHSVRLEVNETILFDPGRSDLRQSGVDILKRLAATLAEKPGVVEVEGHTDSAPIANARFPSNWELSTARAAAVARYLIDQGVPAAKLRAVGVADNRPLADNLTPQGRARNRRVALVLYLDGAPA